MPSRNTHVVTYIASTVLIFTGIGCGVLHVKADVPNQEPMVTYKNTLGMEFVLLPAGEFLMGADREIEIAGGSELPQHGVRIAEPFFLGKFEVTQDQWLAVMDRNPTPHESGSNPVHHVSWAEVQEFIRRLNEMEGTATYMLPSEAEWEYAARAGSQTAYIHGNDDVQLGLHAWYYASSREWLDNPDAPEGRSLLPVIHPVGQLLRNAWGLHDMSGNVSEWVQDCWHPSYRDAPTDGSAWETGNCEIRVHRGGTYYDDEWKLRVAERDFDLSTSGSYACGFRLKLVVP